MTSVDQAGQKPRLALATLVGLTVLFVLFLVLVALSARGPGGQGGATGYIALSDVALQPGTDDWYLHANADIDLPPTVRAGLDSGVPLQFILKISLKNPQPYWFDKTVAVFERRYRLTFYELTRHYRVESLATGNRKNYRSLLSALDGLGTLRNVPVGAGEVKALTLAMTEEDSSEPLIGSLHLQLDTGALPLPLQPLVASAWRLESEEYVWPVN